MKSDNTHTLKPDHSWAVALLTGLAAALLDFNWNLLQTRPHELHADLLLRPVFFLFVVAWLLAGIGLWLSSRRSPRGETRGPRRSWGANWIAFLLLWVVFFNLSESSLSLRDLDSVLRLLAVSFLAALGAYVVARHIGPRVASRVANEDDAPYTLVNRLLLLDVLLVLSVPFLLTEIILVEGMLSTESVLAILLFSAVIVVLLIGYARKPFLFVRFAIVLLTLACATFLVVGARAILISPASGLPSAKSSTMPPIVLITIDTLRADSLGSYGSAKGLTPNLDALARRSVLFERVFSSSPWTLPSMASLMTGTSTLVHQTPDRSAALPLSLPTLAETLQDRGYVTLGVGRNAHLRASTGFSRGFDDYRFYPRTYLADSLGTQLLEAALPGSLDNEGTTEELADRATYLAEQFTGRAFFLWLHIFDPHIPYEPPTEFLPSDKDLDRFGPRFDGVIEVRSGRLFPDPAHREWIRSLYEAEIRYVDDEIGQFLETLEHLDLFDDSLILVTSDHGEEFWEHGGFEHGHTLINEVVQIPLIVKPPHGPSPPPFAGLRIEAPVSITSLRPTILEVVGAETPSSTVPSAESLVPYWSDSPPESDPAPIAIGAMKYFGQQLSLVDMPYKYIRHLEDGREEVYDLVADPRESTNLAELEPQLTDRLAAALNRQVEEGQRIAEELGIGSEPSEVHLDKETERELRSLGYIE